jgi:hypothetical protein
MDDYGAFIVAKAGLEFQMLETESNQRRPRLTERDDVTHRAGESRLVLPARFFICLIDYHNLYAIPESKYINRL